MLLLVTLPRTTDTTSKRGQFFRLFISHFYYYYFFFFLLFLYNAFTFLKFTVVLLSSLSYILHHGKYRTKLDSEQRKFITFDLNRLVIFLLPNTYINTLIHDRYYICSISCFGWSKCVTE